MSLVKSKYIVECGPDSDKRTLKIYLDPFRRRVGILISGGMDSALLYYLLIQFFHLLSGLCDQILNVNLSPLQRLILNI